MGAGEAYRTELLAWWMGMSPRQYRTHIKIQTHMRDASASLRELDQAIHKMTRAINEAAGSWVHFAGRYNGSK